MVKDKHDEHEAPEAPWQKVLAAKHEAEAANPLADRHGHSEQRDMEIFIAMVHAAMGKK